MDCAVNLILFLIRQNSQQRYLLEHSFRAMFHIVTDSNGKHPFFSPHCKSETQSSFKIRFSSTDEIISPDYRLIFFPALSLFFFLLFYFLTVYSKNFNRAIAELVLRIWHRRENRELYFLVHVKCFARRAPVGN